MAQWAMPFLSLSKNLCLEKKRSVSQGEYEGAGVPLC